MALLDDVKSALRVSGTAYDTEISSLISAATQDLKVAGIDIVYFATDELVKRAITVYCKAHFGYNNPEAPRFAESYLDIKKQLVGSVDYVVE